MLRKEVLVIHRWDSVNSVMTKVKKLTKGDPVAKAFFMKVAQRILLELYEEEE